MKITDLELFYLQPRWLFLKISTDEGICGWGEPYALGFAALPAGAAFFALCYAFWRFGVRHYKSTGS